MLFLPPNFAKSKHAKKKHHMKLGWLDEFVVLRNHLLFLGFLVFWIVTNLVEISSQGALITLASMTSPVDVSEIRYLPVDDLILE